eukprot:114085-Alexandrium_andersonii.AAC.1
MRARFAKVAARANARGDGRRPSSRQLEPALLRDSTCALHRVVFLINVYVGYSRNTTTHDSDACELLHMFLFVVFVCCET